MKQITIRLEDEIHKKIKHLTVDLEKSVNEYIVDLIKKDLDERKK